MRRKSKKIEATGERGTWVYDAEQKKLVPKEKFKPKKIVHNVLQDTLPEPIVSHATHEGLKFESKSAYRRHLKEHGFVERGEAPVERESDYRAREEQEDKDRREEIEKSYFDVKYGRVGFTEEEKALFKKEEERCRSLGIPYKVKAPY